MTTPTAFHDNYQSVPTRIGYSNNMDRWITLMVSMDSSEANGVVESIAPRRSPGSLTLTVLWLSLCSPTVSTSKRLLFIVVHAE
jgi:hypothetical protein